MARLAAVLASTALAARRQIEPTTVAGGRLEGVARAAAESTPQGLPARSPGG